MDVEETILGLIRERPGIAKDVLAKAFCLSDYRLNRVFRHINRNLNLRSIEKDPENGLWVVDINPERCLGYEWLGADSGGLQQCSQAPAFNDGRCYKHSEVESTELTAFKRRLAHLLGPCDPNPRYVTQLSLFVVEELFQTLRRISPITQKDFDERMKLLKVIISSRAWLRWKEQMRKRGTEKRVPPEFEHRHRASSVNTFEFSIRKYFAVLEISPDATKEETLKAWKRLARIHHSDAGTQTGGDGEKMKEINFAKDRIFRLRRWD